MANKTLTTIDVLVNYITNSSDYNKALKKSQEDLQKVANDNVIKLDIGINSKKAKSELDGIVKMISSTFKDIPLDKIIKPFITSIFDENATTESIENIVNTTYSKLSTLKNNLTKEELVLLPSLNNKQLNKVISDIEKINLETVKLSENISNAKKSFNSIKSISFSKAINQFWVTDKHDMDDSNERAVEWVQSVVKQGVAVDGVIKKYAELSVVYDNINDEMSSIYEKDNKDIEDIKKLISLRQTSLALEEAINKIEKEKGLEVSEFDKSDIGELRHQYEQLVVEEAKSKSNLAKMQGDLLKYISDAAVANTELRSNEVIAAANKINSTFKELENSSNQTFSSISDNIDESGKSLSKYAVNLEEALSKVRELYNKKEKEALSKEEKTDYIGYIQRVKNLDKDQLPVMPGKDFDFLNRKGEYNDVINEVNAIGKEMVSVGNTTETVIQNSGEDVEKLKDKIVELTNEIEELKEKASKNILDPTEQARSLTLIEDLRNELASAQNSLYNSVSLDSYYEIESALEEINEKYKSINEEFETYKSKQESVQNDVSSEELKDTVKEIMSDLGYALQSSIDQFIERINDISKMDFENITSPLKESMLNIVDEFKIALSNVEFPEEQFDKISGLFEKWNQILKESENNKITDSNKNGLSSGGETRQAEEFRKISEDTVEVLSHEGKTESEIVSLIREEIKAAEALNEVTKEHLILLDKEGKVISDHLGSTSNVNGTFTEEQLARANGGKIQHVHPGKASFFGGKDLSHILQDKAFENIKQIELLWGDSTLSIDKSTLTKQSQSTLLNIMRNVRTALTETYTDNAGGTPSQDVREHINAIEKEIFKSIAQKLNISVSENGEQAKAVTDALSDVDKAIIQRFKAIESNVVQDINPAEIIFNKSDILSTDISDEFKNESNVVKEVTESEQNSLYELSDFIRSYVIPAIQEKTHEFEKEQNTVSDSVKFEVDELQKLAQKLIEISGFIHDLSEHPISISIEGFESGEFDKLKSSIDSLDIEKLNSLSSLFKELSKTNKSSSNIIDIAIALDELQKAISSDSPNEFLTQIKELLSYSKELENLAKILSESEKKISKAGKKVKKDNSSEDQLKYYSKQDIEYQKERDKSLAKGKQQLKEYYDSLLNVEKLEKKVNSYDVQGYSTEYYNKLNGIRDAIEKIKSINDKGLDNITAEDLKDAEEYRNYIDSTLKLLKSNKGNYKLADELNKSKQISKMVEWLIKYQGASKETREEVRKLIDQLNQLDDGDNRGLKEISKAFIDLTSDAKAAGDEVKSMGQKIREQISHKFAEQFARYFSIQDIIRYIRTISSTVTELDSAITELRKVSDATEDRLSLSFEKSAKTAKELGASITDVINVTSDWSRLGYSVDEAEELARVSTLFQNVGDNMDAESANSYLISTLQGFQKSASEAESIIDVYNEVANNFAIDTAGIGEALQRSAASFNAANTDLNESIALITATNAVVQNPESVGTLWKTVSARIRGAKTELEDMGEDTEGMVESTSKLRDLVKGMTGFDIMEDENTFKSIYDIMVGIGEKWQDLTDINQAALLEALAGKRAGNALAATLNNMEDLKGAYEKAQLASGSASKEQENYAKSIQYSIDKVKASAQELAHTFLNSDVIKSLMESFNTFLQNLNRDISIGSPFIKALEFILTTTAKLVENISKIPGAIEIIIALLAKSALSSTKNIFDGISSLENEGNKKGLLSSLLGLFKGKEVVKETTAATEAVSELAETSENAGGAISKLITVVGKETAATEAATIATKGLTTAQAGLIGLGVVAAIALTVHIFDELTYSVNECAEAIAETENKISSLESEIQSLENIGYRNEQQQVRLDLLKQELSIQKQLLDTQKKRNAEELVGTKFSDYFDFDKDNLNSIYLGETNYEKSGSYQNLLNKYSQNNKSIDVWKEELSKATSDEDKIRAQKEIDKRLEKQGEIVADLSEKALELQEYYTQAEDALTYLDENSEEYKSAEALSTEFEKMYKKLNESINAYNKEVGTFDYSSILNGIMNKADFDELKDNFISLAKEGKLTPEYINSYSRLKEELESAGTNAEELYNWIMNLANPNKANIDRMSNDLKDLFDKKNRKQTRNDEFDNFLSGQGLELNDETYQAYLAVKEQFPENETGSWDIDDWIYNIQKKLEKADIKVDAEFNVTDFAKDTDEFENLQSMYQSFRDNLEGDSVTIPIDIGDVEGLRETWASIVGDESFNEFENTITKTGVSAQEVQDAFDKLATEYANAKYQVEEITDANKDMIASQMELDGITKESAKDFVDYYSNLNKVSSMGDIKISTKLKDAVESQMKELNAGGGVDLTLRPVIDASELNEKGWDAGDGIATLFSSTFSNEDNTVAMNFTPIMTDGNGHKIGILTEEELQRYAEKVLNGGEDYYNLKIGATFEGEDAIEQAVAQAGYIHELQDQFYNDNGELNYAIFGNEEALERYAGVLGITTEALARYILEEQLADGLSLDTSAQIQSLLSLANQANLTGSCYEYLIELEEIYAGLEANVYGQGTEDRAKALTRAAKLKTLIEGLVNEGSEGLEFEMPAPTFDPSKVKSSAGGAGKDAADAYVDAYEEELKKLEADRDQGLITEKQFLDKWKSLIDKFFKDVDGYTDKYKSEMSSWQNSMLSYMNSVGSAVISLIDRRIKETEKARDIAIKALEDEKEAALASIDAQIEGIDDLIDAKNDEIDRLQDEIDAIQKVADERQRNLDLMQAEYNLQRALSQRTKLVKIYARSYGNIV